MRPLPDLFTHLLTEPIPFRRKPLKGFLAHHVGQQLSQIRRCNPINRDAPFCA